MPVVWHQSLLCFVQRYKHDLREGDRARLRALCERQHHYQVTPEVLRELEHAAPRGSAAAAAAAAAGAAAAQQQQQQKVGAFGAFAAAAAAAGAAGGGIGGGGVGRHVQEDPRHLPPVPMLDD